MSIINSKKGPVYDPGTCRCCGESKKCRLLNVEYLYQNQIEIYAELFVECFGLVLSHLDGEPRDRLICAMCVSRLREASSFRRQVLQCEEKLLKSRIHVHNGTDEDTSNSYPTAMKTEEVIKEDQQEEQMDCDNIYSDNDADINENVPTNTTDKTELPEAVQTADTSPLRKSYRRLLVKRKEKFKKIQLGTRKPPEPEYVPPVPVQDKVVDTERLIYENMVTVIENSYVCPFQTSFSSYFCVYCKGSFKDPTELREHTAKHNPKRFKIIFTTKKPTYLDIERIDCRLCDTKISDIETFKTHVADHGKKINITTENFLTFRLKSDLIPCTACDKSFSYFPALKRHMAEHFGSFVCAVCGDHFFDQKSLDVHTATHEAGMKYSCDECGKCFKKKYSFRIHVSRVHKKEPAFQCIKCEDALFTEKERDRHMMDVHGYTNLYPCDICDNVYKLSRTLRNHKRMVHIKFFKYKCAICDRGFDRKSKLDEHMISKMHRKGNGYTCNICGKIYPRQYYLKLHIETHSSPET